MGKFSNRNEFQWERAYVDVANALFDLQAEFDDYKLKNPAPTNDPSIMRTFGNPIKGCCGQASFYVDSKGVVEGNYNVTVTKIEEN